MNNKGSRKKEKIIGIIITIIVIVVVLFFVFVNPNVEWQGNKIKKALEKKYNTNFEVEFRVKSENGYREILCEDPVGGTGDCEGPYKKIGYTYYFKITQIDEKIIFYEERRSNLLDMFDKYEGTNTYKLLLDMKEELKEKEIIEEEDIEKITTEGVELKKGFKEKLSIEWINTIVNSSINIDGDIIKKQIYDRDENYINIGENDVYYMCYKNTDLAFTIKKESKEKIRIEAKTDKELNTDITDAYAEKIISMYANFKDLGYSDVYLGIEYADGKKIEIIDNWNNWGKTACIIMPHTYKELEMEEKLDVALEKWE